MIPFTSYCSPVSVIFHTEQQDLFYEVIDFECDEVANEMITPTETCYF